MPDPLAGDIRLVPLEVYHHLEHPVVATTCINLPGVCITVTVARDLDSERQADLLAVLDGMRLLMAQLWAAPDQDGPMVMDLRRGAT